ncbi:hypothetical protein [Kitasatospora sp. NPDC092286]|uniref:hypothetical protein n=1 Tax=Kitasatospora sp. NPDC092286 TaxID=3364087 RepID=UPI00380B7951
MPPSNGRISRRTLMTGAAGTAGAALAASVSTGEAAAASTTSEATAAATAVPAPNPYPLKPPHQIEAETLIDHLRLRPWSHNANQYKTAGEFDDVHTSVTWGTAGHPEEFSNLSQCSSFLTLVLQRAYGGTVPVDSPDRPLPWPAANYGWATREYFQRYFRTDRPFPTAELFQQGFANAADIPHFTAVTKPVNLRPGDLVALDYDPASTTTPYTGHIVMIRERRGTWPDLVDAQVGAGVVPYIFEIIDCTSDPHGNPKPSGATELYRAFPDTRIEESADPSGQPVWTEHNGAGYGHMIFYADAATKLFAGYRWSVNSSTPRRIADRPISAARVYLG